MPPASTSRNLFGRLSVAYAVTDKKDELAALNKRLDRWVPVESEFPEYFRTMERILQLTTDRVLADIALEPPDASLYRTLIPAAALQESCWRQFERKREQIVPVTSSKGSIGLMQINRYVWRGFYNLERLTWDTCYNAQAGAEILMRYMRQYGMQEGRRTGKLDHVARAAYAVYNAGPKAVTRYRSPKATAREKKVDNRFFELYRGFARGGKVNLSTCTVEIGAEKVPT